MQIGSAFRSAALNTTNLVSGVVPGLADAVSFGETAGKGDTHVLLEGTVP